MKKLNILILMLIVLSVGCSINQKSGIDDAIRNASITVDDAIRNASITVDDAIRNASITVSVSGLPSSELKSFIQKLSHLCSVDPKDGTKDGTVKCTSLIEIKKPKDFSDELKTLHSGITSIVNSDGAQVANNTQLKLQLRYSSAEAESASGAHILIEPSAGADLYIDTLLPRINEHQNPNGSIRLNHNRGSAFSISLPIVFAVDNRYIYFRLVTGDITRYFFYDLHEEEQAQAPISNESDWSYFTKHHKLPENGSWWGNIGN